MNSSDVRRLALIYARVARMEAMKAENAIRQMNGEALCYTEDDFKGIAIDFNNLAYCPDEKL